MSIQGISRQFRKGCSGGRLCAILFLLMLLGWCSAGARQQTGNPVDSSQARKLLQTADSFAKVAQYTSATDLTVLALEYFEQAGDVPGEITCLNQLADIYRGTENYPLCRTHLSLAMSLASKHGDSLGLANSENILSAMLFEIGPAKFDSAAKMANRSLQYARKHHDQRLTFLNLNILGMVASTDGRNGEAMRLLQEAYSIVKTDFPADVPLLLTNMARVLFRSGQTAKAEQFGMHAYTRARSGGTVWYIIMSAQFLANLYHTTGRDHLAYPVLLELNDQMIANQKEANEVKIREMNARKLASEKEQENQSLRMNQEVLLQQAKLRLQLQIVFAVLLLMSVILILMLIVQKKKVTAANARLGQLNDEIRREKDKVELVVSELETSNRTLQTFLSVIAHDLRNPMNTIIGFLDILKSDRTTLNEKDSEMAVEYAGRAARAASHLLEELLEWARLQAGIVKPVAEDLELATVCLEVLSVIQPAATLKQLEITCEIDEHAKIHADRHMFMTLLRNLLSNAVKFTQPGGKVSIVSNHDDGFQSITVTDTGIGISSENMKHLFQIDKQVKTRGTGGETGTGLGLLLCREYAGKNGGTITVDSEPGKGTTVRVRIPAA
jgi:signal transduction histidine kinase